ncbi:FAD-binding PCMH-type domain-containing protein [Fusarium sp. Ph1]|nr:FAD-binding PCMH-type domain-containing protein [Fusarium sp. Ph1]
MRREEEEGQHVSVAIGAEPDATDGPTEFLARRVERATISRDVSSFSRSVEEVRMDGIPIRMILNRIKVSQLPILSHQNSLQQFLNHLNEMRIGPFDSELPSEVTTPDERPRMPHTQNPTSPSTAQPSFVGESWYASYFMRGFAPGCTSFHRPIDDCNQTVQNVSRDTPRQNCPRRSPQPRGRTELSDLPRPDLMDRLIHAYFDQFHIFCPIVGKESFAASLHDGTVSGTLLRCVLFVASLHCDVEILHVMGHSTRLDANSDLFNKASTSFDEDTQSDRTSMVLSSYLLHYWFGNPTSYRDAHWWLAAAIRSAQCMGYHRSTKDSQMPPQERLRWKRIWWCLYIRDRQTSLSTGTPMVINDLDHDVEELVMEDLSDETPETARYIISQMELNKTAARLYFLHCSPSRLPLSRETSVRQTAMEDIQMALQSWYTTSEGINVSKRDHHLTLTLKVCYYYYFINLLQRLQRQSNRGGDTKPILDAALQVFGLVEDSLLYWTPEHFPMIYVSALFSAMIAVAADGSMSPPRSDQLLCKIRPGLLALKQFESVYNLARWIRNFFMDILNRSEPHTGDKTAQAQELIEPRRAQNGQPITLESVAQAPAENTVAATPVPAEQPDYSTPSLNVEDPSFLFGHDARENECHHPELARVGGFWPASLVTGIFSGTYNSDVMDFPQPDSLQYQAMHFLADLGIASSDYLAAYFSDTLPDKSDLSRLQVDHRRDLTRISENISINHDTSAANIKAACAEFEQIIGKDHISTERTDLVTHSGSDYQSYAWSEESAILSNVILYPETTEQVSQIVKVCFRRRLPVTPYSGGTSIEGQYIPQFQGICIDFTRMNQIKEINPVDLDCTVQPGIGWVDLNDELASHGLFFPPDPGPGAMIGGMVGTGCSGTNAAAYGTMKDWVLSLTVVLADGTIIQTRQRARKSSAGYDLTRVFVGSEGTLGLVTEATLKLAVKPPHEVVAVCTFPTLRAAASAVREVASSGIQVAAVEILDEVQMRNINLAALTRLKWKEEPTLFFKFAGSDDFIVKHIAKKVGEITKRNGSSTYTFASDESERNELWSARKAALWSMLAQRQSPTDKVWTTDVAVPLSRLPDIIELAKADIEKSGLMGSIVGHVGDGNFHTLLLFPEEKRPIAEAVVHRMVDMAIEMKGTATGEHGIGLVKRDYLEKELGKETVDTMRAMKSAFDPMCILNCDKVIRMKPVEEQQSK